MEYSYYRDARHHYLTIPCETGETYQYRMLAANRMDALIPCTIRSVDGRRYLYYDITARENMEEFFRGHGGAAAEIPRLLYALSDAGAMLERYLLDCRRILLAPEFVYYDYTRGEFTFLYYPEDPEVPSGPAFYEYLADHADPQDKMLYYTLLRLISISANQTFVLDEPFLDHSLGRQRPQEPAAIDGGLPGDSRYADPEAAFDAGWDDEGRAEAMRSGEGTSDPMADALRAEETADTAAHKGSRRGLRLILLLVFAVLLLGGAIGLAYVRMTIPMNEAYDRAALIGMIACLAGSILTAVYGAYRGIRCRGQEITGLRERIVQERRNALAPVEEFR